MTPSITELQSELWLRGLLTIAWSDGNFDDREKEMINTFMEQNPETKLVPVTADELRSAFANDPGIGGNFLRSAVMVALADGVYSSTEDEILNQFCNALGTSHEILETLRLTLCDLETKTISPLVSTSSDSIGLQKPSIPKPDPLKSVRVWLDGMEISEPKVARFLCKLIPSQCPFERDVVVFGKKLAHIPPMCKINPLYDQLVGLRFRSLSYLADVCKEDITPYI
jgi:tellurite resistance protein